MLKKTFNIHHAYVFQHWVGYLETSNTYDIQFCHKIQYIITTKRNEAIYAWVTLGFIGKLFSKQTQWLGNCMEIL